VNIFSQKNEGKETKLLIMTIAYCSSYYLFYDVHVEYSYPAGFPCRTDVCWVLLAFPATGPQLFYQRLPEIDMLSRYGEDNVTEDNSITTKVKESHALGQSVQGLNVKGRYV